MALEVYREKRRFDKTSEPQGGETEPLGNTYLIQKHAARRLHYDLRLEMDGVLKSWAVTKGPSLVPGEKRLAVHVEDHPLEYGTFEGTIPKGEYGGGTVLLWDQGSWSPVGDMHKGYAKGHLEFELHGEKLHGRWHLVRMHGKPGEKHENWLLIKGEDEAARTENDGDILEERPESVKTGRALDAIAQEAPGWSSKTGRIDAAPEEKPSKRTRKAAPAAEAPTSAVPLRSATKSAKPAPLPDFVEPALASLVAKAPSGNRWLHEIKFDGYRLQIRIDHQKVKLLTRSGLDWTPRFGDALLSAFQRLPVETALLDGELVVETESGVTSFPGLQLDLSEGRTDRFVFCAFDLLHLDGRDLRPEPLMARKEALGKLLADVGHPIRYSEHFQEDGDLILRHACRLSLEGLISKLKESPYRSGRSKAWVKSKCRDRQEFVIGGYVVSTTSSQAIGSLVLGVYEAGKLRHVGRVGTGFSTRLANDLFQKLEPLRRTTSPFGERLSADAARGVRYVEPKEVAEIEFRGWTTDRNLRQAAFRGLREDKPAEQVVQEQEGAADVPAPARKVSVTLTHPDRVYWPEDGITKEGLANYYAEVWPYIAPFIVARPLALLRCPDGIVQACFVQKHAWRGINKAIKLVPDPHDPDGEQMLTINDLDGLTALVQSATLEIHPWGSSLTDLEQPDIMIFDLDPSEDVTWADVIAAARHIKDTLEGFGLAAFVKTSGGKGLHVCAPLKPSAGWDEVKRFSKTIADTMAADDPDHFIAVMTKAKRRGKIFIDYLRNGRGATAVAPYSPRARAGAAVSMPLSWDELDSVNGPAYFTMNNAAARLANQAEDPWRLFRQSANPLPAAKTRKS